MPALAPIAPDELSDHDTRVLIVDDEQMVAQALALSLGREQGLEMVELVGSLAEAERLMLRAPVDVVVCAHRLPDADGILACSRLRRVSPGVKVLILGVSIQPAVVRRAVEAGCCGFITRLHTVRNHIRKILEKVGTHSRLEAVAIATRQGLLAAPGPDALRSR